MARQIIKDANQMKYLTLIIMIFCAVNLSAQDDLLKDLDGVAQKSETEYTYATFKATRIITAQSIESMKTGQLEFRIAHRFGRLNTGVDNLYGLDQSNIYFDLELGLNDWLEIGLGRTPVEKTINTFAKAAIYKQSSCASNMPVSISYFGSVATNSGKFLDQTRTNYFSSRLTYTNQILIAKKFDDNLSLQLMPTLIHRNLVSTALDDNDLFAMGIGGRYKLSTRVSFNFEYFYVLHPIWNKITVETKNPLSVGFDIETGGHVFQLMLTNSFGAIEKHYIADNTGDWTKGDIHLGFNISRPFTIFGE